MLKCLLFFFRRSVDALRADKLCGILPSEACLQRGGILSGQTRRLVAANWRQVSMHISIVLLFLPAQLSAQRIIIGNRHIGRELTREGQVWRTTAFVRGDEPRLRLPVHSEEVNILPMDSAEGYGIGNFYTLGKPVVHHKGDSSWLNISYKPVAAIKGLRGVPDQMVIRYYVASGDDVMRKSILLYFDTPQTVDRLEVERFNVSGSATGGGRGQPVFIDSSWFFGLEYPAGYSRHTDGNTPVSYGRYFEKVGNYSFIDLAGRDIEPRSKKGMLRLMHFPGYAKKTSTQRYVIQSKSAVAGSAPQGVSARRAFMGYLHRIWKKPRSFLHYNNWFDQKAKDLSGNALLEVYESYRRAIEPFGVHLDAVVPDNGWQDRKSIWEPNPRYFPHGDADLAALSIRLKKVGVGFGLWLSLNGYVNDIEWGEAHGYHRAIPNKYFQKFGSYYSLSADQYKRKMLQRLPALARLANLKYLKHDFNNLSDIGPDNGHPADDRHGHEANVDAAIEILQATSRAVPGILQNMTNWVWFSPWWLQYGDYLWMLAGDDGQNGNQPELSLTAQRTTDRDTYIWRMWGNPEDRPLVPISRLMTHGIIRSHLPASTEKLQDWLEYVLMYYGRGTLLKEWYISAETMTKDAWQGLCQTDNWAARHRRALNRTVFVGGRPDEGHAYGYIGWKPEGDSAVLVARNPGPDDQTLDVPITESYGYFGRSGRSYKADVVFPYQANYPATFWSGNSIRIVLPGYATMALEITKGVSKAPAFKLKPVDFYTAEKGKTIHTTLQVPKDASGLCVLQVIGYPASGTVDINGKQQAVMRSNTAHLNNFAGYAKWGMFSEKARKWEMSSFDLTPYRGKKIDIEYHDQGEFQSYLQVERPVPHSKAVRDHNHLWPITQGTRRQSVRLH